MEEMLRKKLNRLIGQCEILRKNGRMEDCIQKMEKIAGLIKNAYGIDHQECKSAFKKLCEYLNEAAMIYLNKQEFDSALNFLKKAEFIAKDSSQLEIVTFNNLACYFKRIGKFRPSLSYLLKVFQLEIKMQKSPPNIAYTHLNLGSVLSQLNRHEDAIHHSMHSIILLQDEFIEFLLPKVKDQECDKQIDERKYFELAFAYNKLGTQLQHLKRDGQALKIYQRAHKFYKGRVGKNIDFQTQRPKKDMFYHIDKVINTKEQQLKENLYNNLSKKVEKYRKQVQPNLQSNEKSSNGLYQPNYGDFLHSKEDIYSVYKHIKSTKERKRCPSSKKQDNSAKAYPRPQQESKLKSPSQIKIPPSSQQNDQ